VEEVTMAGATTAGDAGTAGVAGFEAGLGAGLGGAVSAGGSLISTYAEGSNDLDGMATSKRAWLWPCASVLDAVCWETFGDSRFEDGGREPEWLWPLVAGALVAEGVEAVVPAVAPEPTAAGCCCCLMKVGPLSSTRFVIGDKPLKRDSPFFGGAIGSSNGFVICLNLLETIRR
jgi:hypothetical protein